MAFISSRNLILATYIGTILSFLFLVKDVLWPFSIGAVIAYFLAPTINKLENINIPRWLSSILFVCTITFVILTVLIFGLPVISKQMIEVTTDIANYLNTSGKDFYDKIESAAMAYGIKNSSISETLTAYTNQAVKMLGSFMNKALSSAVGIISAISIIIITPITAYYFLKEWKNIIRSIDEYLPREQAPSIRIIIKEIDRVMSGYIRGQTNVCLFLGIFYAIMLFLIGLKYGLLIGITSGILTFIPYIGAFMGAFIAVLIALFQWGGDIWYIVSVISIFIIGQFIEGSFVTPRFIGNKVGLHPMWVMFGILAGGKLMGFLGIALGVPLTAIAGILVKHSLSKYKKGFVDTRMLS